MTATTPGHHHHHQHHSFFRVYGVPLTILTTLFVVSWYTEFFSLTAFGILDDHRKTTTNKPYPSSINKGRGNNTAINETSITLDEARNPIDLELTSASNTNHTISPSITIATPQHVPIINTSQTQEPNKNNSSDDSSPTPTLPGPLQVLNEYKQQHSIQALIQDKAAANSNNNFAHRKFVVVYYYCPHRAGNILHNLFNSITWAMIHNRTILWKYDTDFTSHRNTVEDCQAVLERAEWIASWDEWAPRLGLVSDDDNYDHENDVHDVIMPIPMDRTRLQYDQQHRVVVYPQIKDVMKSHSNLFRTEWRDDPAHSRNHLFYIRDLGEEAKLRAAKLYDYGVDFLFGMLFREIFTVKVAVENPFDKLRSNHHSHDVFSLALHSRHTVIGDDGSYIPDEIKCLEQLLPIKRSRTLETCVVYLMSDRPRTIQKLSTWLEQHNCTGVTASAPPSNNNSNETDNNVSTVLLLDEMGPNQGEGFIRELELASRARSGLIGDFHRSSFMLLVELVEYERKMENWKNGREVRREDDGDGNKNISNSKTTKLLRCNLPERYGAGYDYGPGTPTFRAAHHRKPLAPIQVFNEYKSMHSANIIRQETGLKEQENHTSRLFAVGYLPCPIDSSIDGIRSFLNDILLAVASNRTTLWKYASVGSESSNTLSSCNRFLRPNDWLPSYDELSERLGLSGAEEVHVLSGENSTMLNVNLRTKSEQVVLFPDHLRRERLNSSSLVSVIIPDNNEDVNSSQAEMLYSEGIDFLYGMLLDEAFQFRAIVQEPALSQSNVLVPGTSFTLGLHVDSVHDFGQTNSCLKTTFSNVSTGRCDIYLATSDERLAEFDRLGSCSIHTLNKERGIAEDKALDEVSSTNLRFFQDLLCCARQVRSGFIGKAGSSASALFVERIEYLRRIEIWKQGRIPRILPDFKTCQA